MQSSSLSMRRMLARRTPGKQAWSSEDIRLLRQLASDGLPLEIIAARLRRSPSAVRNKATMHGVSLRSRADDDHALEICENDNLEPAA
ncbi:hypothetical protein [Povalibacter sp.]|uniref:hypothetical protein n=1 Tax=Povalibacter sp. TaxID=1962978 RepID=UPI002F3F35CA